MRVPPERSLPQDELPMTPKLPELLRSARRIAFFTGAGASTEPPTSIPDFRSASGLYSTRLAMSSLTRGNFFRHPEDFWVTFREIFLPWAGAQPNAVHRAPPRLAALGKEVAVVTQNVDGLDWRLAQGWPVYELHGHLRSASCPECGAVVEAERYPERGVPRCRCGAVLKPDVVLFDDPVDQAVFADAAQALAEADLIVVVGTSLAVAPACLLVEEQIDRVPTAILNRDPTPLDGRARLVVRGSAGEALQAALDAIE
jgi:NAD-dependent deacetylase